MARVLDNRYRILRNLGIGGMGEVFLAEDEVLGRKVALKLLSRNHAWNEGSAERFRREARSAATLSHSNIVAVHDFRETGDEDFPGSSGGGRAYYIVMEYVEGTTLKDLLAEQGPLPWRDAASVAARAARGLAEAHRQGIVHRDVKPANILMSGPPEGDSVGDLSRWVVKVTDFGVARVGAASTLTQDGALMGTAPYVSPEMVMGEPATPRSDLYSLGVVLYEMLTGRRPFEAAEHESPIALAMRHVTEVPRPPSAANPQVPREIGAVAMRLLGKDPEERHENASAVADELDGLLAAPSVRSLPKLSKGRSDKTPNEPPRKTAPPGSRKENRRRRGRRRAVAVLVATAFLLVGGSVGVDRLSDGGVSRVLGTAIPFGAPGPASDGRGGSPDVPAEPSPEAVVEDFVMRVWGYAGNDEEEYWSRVEPFVTEEFRSSPAWGEVESGAEVARQGGPAAIESFVATEFQRFEVLEEGPESVVGVAYFTNEKYPEGRQLDYRQEFGLAQAGGSWRLIRGEGMEPVNGAAAGEVVKLAVEEYYAAVDRDDWAYTYSHLDARARELFSEDEWRRRNQYFARNEGVELSSISVEATLSSGSTASVKVDRTFEDGTFLTRETFFVYEGGLWKHRLSQEEVDAFMPTATYEEFADYWGAEAPFSG